MNYKEVFQLAQTKGYDSILVHVARYGGEATKPTEEINEAASVSQLTLIQKWLREKHGIDVTAYPIYKGIYGWDINYQAAMSDSKQEQGMFETEQVLFAINGGFDMPPFLEEMTEQKMSYEAALLQGVAFGLRSINLKTESNV